MTRKLHAGVLVVIVAGLTLVSMTDARGACAGDVEIDPVFTPAITYHAEQLPTFPGFPYPRTSDIDSEGDIVGTNWACPFILSCLSQTFLYTHGQLVHTSEAMINAVPEPFVGVPVTLDMCNTNKIVIRMAVPDVGVYHYLWDHGVTILISGDPDDDPTDGGPLVPMPPPPGTAWQVNDNGVVVGNVTLDGQPSVFLWNRAQGVTQLIAPPEGFAGISARGINNHNDIVGTVGNGLSNVRAFLWSDGVFMILEPIPGHIESQALRVNDAGFVVGTSREPTSGNHVNHLVMWHDGRIVDSVVLDYPNGLIQSPMGMNNQGDVVGNYWPINVTLGHLGFRWSQEDGFHEINGTIENLPQLNIWSAEGINDAGQIAAWGDFPDFTGGAFLLTPIFETPGDLNGDGSVNESDRALLCAAIGSSTGEPAFLDAADLNEDGTIDHLDLQLFNDILPPCAGDLVTSETFAPPPDGVTDGADLAFLLGAWASQPSCADMVSSGTFAPPPDGVVDGADLAYLLGAWGLCN